MSLGFPNPYRPGAGHPPPHLAGRQSQIHEFEKLLEQDAILENLVLTGLRGVGKTVLLERFKPIAQDRAWLWVGTDLSESASLTEERLALRLLTDLSVVTASLAFDRIEVPAAIGFDEETTKIQQTLSYATLEALYRQAPGLVADRLKMILETVWQAMGKTDRRGIVFAYDEAQVMADHATRDEYPLSLLLDVFQSIQRKGIRFMLALTGLPTLFPKLVEARTFAERMFHVIFLDRLDREQSEEAITVPIEDAPIKFSPTGIEKICDRSGGYPYFIQFICREAFDFYSQKSEHPLISYLAMPVQEIVRKLDADFFAGRWARATDRQQDLLYVAACVGSAEDEFTVQELVSASKAILRKGFSASHVNQMLSSLMNASLIFKTRHGKYCFAVPLIDQFILRQDPPGGVLHPWTP